jgi:hypothetical protein
MKRQVRYFIGLLLETFYGSGAIDSKRWTVGSEA